MREFKVIKNAKVKHIATLAIEKELFEEMSDSSIAYFINKFIKKNNCSSRIGVCHKDVRTTLRDNENICISVIENDVVVNLYKTIYSYGMTEINSFGEVEVEEDCEVSKEQV